MLEGSRCGQAAGSFQLLDQLDGVEGIQKIDVAGLAVQNSNGQVRAIFHINAAGLLVGVAAVLQCEFIHWCILLGSSMVYSYSSSASSFLSSSSSSGSSSGSSGSSRSLHTASYLLKIMSPLSPLSRSMTRANRLTLLSAFRLLHRPWAKSPRVRGQAKRSGSPSKLASSANRLCRRSFL